MTELEEAKAMWKEIERSYKSLMDNWQEMTAPSSKDVHVSGFSSGMEYEKKLILSALTAIEQERDEAQRGWDEKQQAEIKEFWDNVLKHTTDRADRSEARIKGLEAAGQMMRNVIDEDQWPLTIAAWDALFVEGK